VNAALKSGFLRGYVSETVVTLEGIQRVERAKVFGSTHLETQPSTIEVDASGNETHHVEMKTEQPARAALHPENAARLAAALKLGFRVLSAPRIGGPKINDPNKTIYAQSAGAELGARLDRFAEIGRAIERRGYGTAPVKNIAARLAKKAGVKEPWYRSLDRATPAEEKEIANAIAEWADSDTVAAHHAFQIDYLCTGDKAAKAKDSIFSPDDRAWLAETYGMKFITISELAALLDLPKVVTR
jgi:hypothetical protein